MSNGKYSISVAQGRVAHEHDDRDYTPKNADWSLRNRNVVIKKSEDYQSVFNDLFRDSLAEYNAKQKREDRKNHMIIIQKLKMAKVTRSLFMSTCFKLEIMILLV